MRTDMKSKDLVFPVLSLSLTGVLTLTSTQSSPSTAPPLFSGRPFIVTWSIPDFLCRRRYNISLDTSPFHGVSNPAKVPGQFLVLFYPDRLGLYPHVSSGTRRRIYGGIPQRGNLKASLEKSRADIVHYIPSEESSGLAVIDWEDWRPLWERNWGSKRIYQTMSIRHAQHMSHRDHRNHRNHRNHRSHRSHGNHRNHRDHRDHGNHGNHRNHRSHRDHRNHRNHRDHRNHRSHKSHRNHGNHRSHRNHRGLTEEQVVTQAKHHFQFAAKSYMLRTLTLGAKLRPRYLWGFYLFPSCYNYGWDRPGYTGLCSEQVQKQNEMLMWLWEVSTALFPSIYLHSSLADQRSALLMVQNRVLEALRVAALPRRTHTGPVYVFSRPVFTDQNKRLLSQADLISTLGESAALGASGVVFWGSSADYDDKASCEAFSTHLDKTINPYITNLTTAASLCSNFLCQGKGRCVRKSYNSGHYLHLNSSSFRIRRGPAGPYEALGKPSLTDLQVFTAGFTCQCYTGLRCEPETLILLTKELHSSTFHTINTTQLSVNQTQP